MLCLTSTIMALDTPKASTYDPRIRRITYNPWDVIQIEAVVGIATHLVVEAGEEYLTHAFGDAAAWTFAYQLNHYFIKPIAEDASTNLTIITNKRTYYLRLHYNPSQDAKAMYGVKFVYPETNWQVKQDSLVEQRFNTPVASYNLSYTMSGDLDLAPVNVWDNHQFTYFKFASQADLPGIYYVDTEGGESIVNRHTAGEANNIIVVHKVSPRWVLRLGHRALAIYNEAYSRQGVDHRSGTAVENVKRAIKR